MGIDLEVVAMDWAAITDLMREREFLLYAAGMGVRPDADHVFHAEFHSKPRRNDSGYINLKVDRISAKVARNIS